MNIDSCLLLLLIFILGCLVSEFGKAAPSINLYHCNEQNQNRKSRKTKNEKSDTIDMKRCEANAVTYRRLRLDRIFHRQQIARQTIDLFVSISKKMRNYHFNIRNEIQIFRNLFTNIGVSKSVDSRRVAFDIVARSNAILFLRK